MLAHPLVEFKGYRPIPGDCFRSNRLKNLIAFLDLCDERYSFCDSMACAHRVLVAGCGVSSRSHKDDLGGLKVARRRAQGTRVQMSPAASTRSGATLGVLI